MQVALPRTSFILPVGETWFHATTVPNWLITVQGCRPRPYVHVGTRHAALERAAQFSRTGPRLPQSYDLHRLYIDAQALVYPHIVQDLDDWVDVVQDDGPQVYAYRNEYEHSGSVSLMVDPRVLSLGGTQTLPKGLLVQRRIV